MKRKGTLGAFTQYCGGRVTEKCIERALNSNDETLRKRAQFAKNMRMQTGGFEPTAPMEPIAPQPLEQAEVKQEIQVQQPEEQAEQPVPGQKLSEQVAKGANAAGQVGDALDQGDGMTGKQVAGKALKSAGKGAATGASVGAAVGSVVPVVGNAIGAAVGAIGGAVVGGIGGLVKGKKEQREAQEEVSDEQQAAIQQNVAQQQQQVAARYGRVRAQEGTITPDDPKIQAATSITRYLDRVDPQRLGMSIERDFTPEMMMLAAAKYGATGIRHARGILNTVMTGKKMPNRWSSTNNPVDPKVMERVAGRAPSRGSNTVNLKDVKYSEDGKWGMIRNSTTGEMEIFPASTFKKRDGGMKELPGGVMKPIGYGAFKFEGNKHDEAGMGSDSGIILEEGGKKKQGLEVEDGELQVNVNTKKGKKQYIVSDYIKNPATGNTLAEDLEAELAGAKNKQEAAKITARYVRLNEKLRDNGKPEEIEGGREKAKKGKPRKGGRRARKQYEEEVAQVQAERDRLTEEYETDKANTEARNKEIEEENARRQQEYDDAVANRERILKENEERRAAAAELGAVEEIDPETGQRIYGESVVNKQNRPDAIRNFYDRMTTQMEDLPEGVDRFDFNPYMTEGEFDPTKFDTSEAKDSFRSWYNSLDDDLVTGKIASQNMGRDLVFGDQWNSRQLLKRAGAPPVPEDYAPTEQIAAPEMPEMPGMPEDPGQRIGGRFTGTTLQALGPAARLLGVGEISTAKMAPAYAKEIRMGRVNLDPERAAAAQASQAASQGITSAVAGPAALAMQQKNLAAGQQAQRGITDQENRANIQIANQEKGINAGIRQNNARNAMTASAQNAAAMNRTAAFNAQTKMSALNQLGRIGTQTVKDYNQQYADRFAAQASQVDGEFDRALVNYYNPTLPFGIGSTPVYPEGGSTLNQQQLDAYYNNRSSQEQQQEQTEQQPTARKGRYIKKTNKVRRKKKKK